MRKPYLRGSECHILGYFFVSFSGPPPGGPPESILGGFWNRFGLHFGIFLPSFFDIFLARFRVHFGVPLGLPGGETPGGGEGSPYCVFNILGPEWCFHRVFLILCRFPAV